MLTISNLNVGYGPVQVLFGVSLAAQAGQCVGVLGPNGAGKTTLLRAISGFLVPTSGTIEFDGQSIGADSAAPDREARNSARCFRAGRSSAR